MAKSTATGNLNPNEFSIIYGAHVIKGYADGTFINIVYNANTFEMMKGADGEAARVLTNDNSVTVTVTLLQTSSSNTVLSGFSNIDKKTGLGALPFLVKDNSGFTKGGGSVAWIQKDPDQSFSKSVETRDWTFVIPHYEGIVGGNNQLI